MNKRIIAIAGPSASGKTGLSIELAKAVDGEIISVDSRQIYKGLDIGSAKPTMEERQGIPHYMTDITEVTKQYSAAEYSDDAKQIIEDILNRNKVPILAGGTGLYYRVMLQDFDLPRVPPDADLRKDLNKKTSAELYNMLENYDKVSAEKIHYNNKVKIIRALEVCIKTGMPMSSVQKKKTPDYEIIWVGLNSEDRDYIYNRINIRVDMMLDMGLENEAEKLFEKYGENNILLNTIGYQELYPYFQGKINLDEAVNMIKQNTRRYAKRQISWFKANKEMEWFDIKTCPQEEIKETIIKNYKNKKNK